MRTNDFLKELDNDRIVQAIGAAELLTSGEIRVFIRRGDVDDVLAEARAQFTSLGMTATREGNAVLIFVAPRSQKFAVLGDEGIHQRCGASFWEELVAAMHTFFKAQSFSDAVVHAIERTGVLLAEEFPRQPDDRNELPNAVEEG